MGEPAFRVCLLGGFRAFDGPRRTYRFAAPRVEALFSFLLLGRERVWSRDTLMETFWGHATPRAARDSLNTAVSQLRRALRPFGPRAQCLVVDRRSIRIDGERLPWLDVQEFEYRASQALSDRGLDVGGLDNLRLCDLLYPGPLLDGLDAEWSLVERERFERVHLMILERLADVLDAAGDSSGAAEVDYRIVNIDPLREDVHRRVMRRHLRAGRRADALRQYAQLRRLLRKELGIEPTFETAELARQIQRTERASSRTEGTNELSAVILALDALKAQLSALRVSIESLGPADLPGGDGLRRSLGVGDRT